MAGYRGGFGGGFGGNQMQQLMKQAQKMQQEMQKAQEELENAEVEGVAQNGLVKVVLSGKKELKGITIDPSIVDADDVEMLEDLITVAFQDAFKKAEELNKSKLGNMNGLV